MTVSVNIAIHVSGSSLEEERVDLRSALLIGGGGFFQSPARPLDYLSKCQGYALVHGDYKLAGPGVCSKVLCRSSSRTMPLP